jgi:alpha-glucosidase (family GH31 glycosyl hydrolase)
MEVKNEKDTPIYEITPVLPEPYYEWHSKQIMQPGQHQLFYSDQEIPMFIKAGTVLPLLQLTDKCKSLTLCYRNEYTLQIYLNSA